MGFEKQDLDYAMVPAGLLAMAAYHAWLLYRIVNYPATTVIGINAINREVWVDTIMQDGIKNGVLAVQTLRNNIMASTLLASTAITLSSLIGVLVSGTAGSGAAGALIYGDESRLGSSIKYFAILACFLVAFVCNVQCVRYYSHVSFLINVPAGKHVAGGHLAEYVSRALNRKLFLVGGAESLLLLLPAVPVDVRPNPDAAELLYAGGSSLFSGHRQRFQPDPVGSSGGRSSQRRRRRGLFSDHMN